MEEANMQEITKYVCYSFVCFDQRPLFSPIGLPSADGNWLTDLFRSWLTDLLSLVATSQGTNDDSFYQKNKKIEVKFIFFFKLDLKWVFYSKKVEFLASNIII